MFSHHFEGGLYKDLSDLPLVKSSESDVTPEGLGGARMDIEARERPFLAEAINADICVSKGGYRSDGQEAKMQVVASSDKCAPFRSLGTADGEAAEAGSTGFVIVVATVNRPVDVDSVVEPRGV